MLRRPIPRVLVVDDEPLVCEAFAAVLRDAGYDVREAPTGLAALSLLRGWRPDVILLDLVLPVMNGWRFADEYRRRYGQRAAILVLTAAGPRALRSAARLPVEDVLPKPLPFDRLLDLVAAHVRQRRSLRAS